MVPSVGGLSWGHCSGDFALEPLPRVSTLDSVFWGLCCYDFALGSLLWRLPPGPLFQGLVTPEAMWAVEVACQLITQG
jgi:hypothetical protein